MAVELLRSCGGETLAAGEYDHDEKGSRVGQGMQANLRSTAGDGGTRTASFTVNRSFIGVALWLAIAVVSSAPAEAQFAGSAWGRNAESQLDDWTGVDRHTPVPMRDLQMDVKVLAGGDFHTLALKADGTVWAWGSADSGQVGNGRRSTIIASPVQVLSDVVAIAAGWEHSLALKRDGTVWAWGSNVQGTLGDGTRIVRTRPVQVRNLGKVSAIAAGESHSLALKTDGTVWSWGRRAEGQLGYEPPGNRAIPHQVANLNGVQAIAAGANHSLALKKDGTVWAWGDNANGDLGDGTLTMRTTPVRVYRVDGLSRVKAISAGASHSLALEDDGTVWAWGYKLDGSTFDSNNLSLIPTQVPDLAGVTRIASGHLHNLVLLSDGTVRAWGQNNFGRLGDGGAEIHRTPVPVLNLTHVLDVAAGGAHSLAITGNPQSNPVEACRLRDWACSPEPQLTPGSITLQCDAPNCIVIDRVPRNCQSKYGCPGCVAGGLCPPVYEMSFEGLRDVWTVALVDTEGKSVTHDLARTPTGVVLSFRPSKEKFVPGRIGDYILVFQMTPRGVPGVKYQVRAGLSVNKSR